MYKVLLVDDEYFAREALKQPFSWQSYGCTICGEANNGLDGLEKARELQPDIVLADINMPFLDGLGMIEKMQSFLPDAIYAIVTGYSEFEYAKRGIELGVEHFIVKPVDDAELSKTVKKMTEALGERQARRQEYKSLRFWAEKNASDNKNHLLQMLLFDAENVGEDRFAYECNHLAPSMLLPGYGVCAIKVELSDQRFDTALCQRVEALLDAEKRWEYALYDRGLGRMYLIFSGIGPKQWDIVQMQALMQKIQLELMRKTTCTVVAGVGCYCESYRQITTSRKEAEKATADLATSKLITQVLCYIHDHYDDSDLTVTGIAKELFVNYSYLSGQFAKETGMTASQYILRFRMTKAADVLRTGADDMVKIAMQVGYPDVKYFYRCFKKEFGVTPYQYLESLQKR